MSTLDQMERNRILRMDEFRIFGINVERGPVLGAMWLSATNAEKVLKLLRKYAASERRCSCGKPCDATGYCDDCLGG